MANAVSSGTGGCDVGGKPGSMVSWKAGDGGAREDRGRGSSGRRSTQLLSEGEGVEDREMRLRQRGVSLTPWIPVNSASTDDFRCHGFDADFSPGLHLSLLVIITSARPQSAGERARAVLSGSSGFDHSHWLAVCLWLNLSLYNSVSSLIKVGLLKHNVQD